MHFATLGEAHRARSERLGEWYNLEASISDLQRAIDFAREEDRNKRCTRPTSAYHFEIAFSALENWMTLTHLSQILNFGTGSLSHPRMAARQGYTQLEPGCFLSMSFRASC